MFNKMHCSISSHMVDTSRFSASCLKWKHAWSPDRFLLVMVCTQWPFFPFPFFHFIHPSSTFTSLCLFAGSLPPFPRVVFYLVCRPVWWPDGGAADQDVPIPWRQSDQRGLEPRLQTFCYWRTKGTVLSVCKWNNNKARQLHVANAESQASM